MINVASIIEIVKDQLSFNLRRQSSLEGKNGPHNARKAANHRRAAEDLQKVLTFLETVSDKQIDTSGTVSPSLNLLPSDLDGLPEELINELNLSDSDKQEFEILGSLEKAGGVLTIDKLMIQLYRDTGKINNRKALAAKLYRMTQKNLIKSNPEKRGAYEIVSCEDNEHDEVEDFLEN